MFCAMHLNFLGVTNCNRVLKTKFNNHLISFIVIFYINHTFLILIDFHNECFKINEFYLVK